MAEEGFGLAQTQTFRADQTLEDIQIKGFQSRAHAWAWGNVNILNYIRRFILRVGFSEWPPDIQKVNP